jgi:hypothetical protein
VYEARVGLGFETMSNNPLNKRFCQHDTVIVYPLYGGYSEMIDTDVIPEIRAA